MHRAETVRPERRLTPKEKRGVGQDGPQRQGQGLTALLPQQTGLRGSGQRALELSRFALSSHFWAGFRATNRPQTKLSYPARHLKPHTSGT